MEVVVGLILLFYPKLIAGTIVLFNKYVKRRDIAHRREKIVLYTRLVGVAFLTLFALEMVVFWVRK